jgi:hypothetical protein
MTSIRYRMDHWPLDPTLAEDSEKLKYEKFLTKNVCIFQIVSQVKHMKAWMACKAWQSRPQLFKWTVIQLAFDR